nr:11222_t:CDS:2 [Entrophospora candida]
MALASRLPKDCLENIFLYLEEDYSLLHSLLLVNRNWFASAIPILWRRTFTLSNFKSKKKRRIIETYLRCLENDEDYYKDFDSIQLNNIITVLLSCNNSNNKNLNYLEFSSNGRNKFENLETLKFIECGEIELYSSNNNIYSLITNSSGNTNNSVNSINSSNNIKNMEIINSKLTYSLIKLFIIHSNINIINLNIDLEYNSSANSNTNTNNNNNNYNNYCLNNLIELIAANCPNLLNLKIKVYINNLVEIIKLLKECRKLKSLILYNNKNTKNNNLFVVNNLFLINNGYYDNILIDLKKQLPTTLDTLVIKIDCVFTINAIDSFLFNDYNDSRLKIKLSKFEYLSYGNIYHHLNIITSYCKLNNLLVKNRNAISCKDLLLRDLGHIVVEFE